MGGLNRSTEIDTDESHGHILPGLNLQGGPILSASIKVGKSYREKEVAMPYYENGSAKIYYEEAGEGFPLLIIPDAIKQAAMG